MVGNERKVVLERAYILEVRIKSLAAKRTVDLCSASYVANKVMTASYLNVLGPLKGKWERKRRIRL